MRIGYINQVRIHRIPEGYLFQKRKALGFIKSRFSFGIPFSSWYTLHKTQEEPYIFETKREAAKVGCGKDLALFYEIIDRYKL